MVKTEKEKTIWKTFPEINFLQANQYGEVRTRDRVVICKNGSKRLVKGRILKQQLNRGGYLYVHFSVNGKQVNLLVHRIVATCFLPNPDNLPEINHRDNNPKNNCVSNLEWCTNQYNITYRERYGKACNRSVFAVNLKTLEVLRFKSQSEAARQLGIDRENINSVVKGRLRQAGGYLFTEDESEITEEKIQEARSNMRFWGGVIVVNLETLKVSYFESQMEASRQLRVPHSSINGVLKDKLNKTHNHWFCHVDEDVVEKTRKKFGDDVANRVRELINK